MSETGSRTSERRDGIQVLARAAEVLRQLAAAPDGLTLIELADRAGLPRTTAYRIVGALSKEGFVTTTAAGKTRIGPALVGIAASGRRDLRHEAVPFLKRLSHELHETVELVVLDGQEALFTEQFVSSRTLRVVAGVGSRFPLHCTACGKALLAALPPGEAERLLPPKLAKATPHTIVDRKTLLRELEVVRATHVAHDHEEHTVGVCAQAVSLHDAAGAIAAVTVVMPATRAEESEQRVARALLRSCHEIQAVLDGR